VVASEGKKELGHAKEGKKELGHAALPLHDPACRGHVLLSGELWCATVSMI